MVTTLAPTHSDFSASQFSPPLPPPFLDSQRKNVPELVAHHVEHNPDYPVFQYADATKSVHRVTWSAIANAILSVVELIEDDCNSFTNSSEPCVIGILGNLDSITYFCLILGIKFAGCIPFPISLRNSAEGVAHLLSTTNCRALFKSEDRLTQDLRNASMQLLDGIKIHEFIVPELSFLLDHRDGPVSLKPPINVRDEDISIIYHTSGSTGHPKPIYLSNEIVSKWAVGIAYRDSGLDTTTEIISVHGLPFYHVMVYCVMLSSMMVGTIVSVFDPTQELVTPSPESLLNAAVASHSNMMFTLPLHLETWSKSPESIELLKQFTSIMFGGGPTSLEAGEKLFQEGVHLSPMYGATETGPLAVFLRVGLESTGWTWLKTRPGLDLVFVPVEGGSYKLIVKENELRKLAVHNTTVDGVPAYDTKDIVVRHPSDPTLWRVENRQDTLIIHSSGEKTNPIPIEERLLHDERIAAAVMFGREQLLAGVVILPAEGYAVDVANSTEVKDYCNLIWDTILEANAKAPAHSRIFKEMIIIASSSRPFEYTDKGFPKRHSVLHEYREEIQKLYSDMDSGVMNDSYDFSMLAAGSDLDAAKYFVRSVVSHKMSQIIGDDDNIFSCGADSLCAMSIRNTLMRLISRKIAAGLANENADPLLSSDLVFAHPTITALGSVISNLPVWSQVRESFNKSNEQPSKDELETFWTRDHECLTAPSGVVKYRNDDTGIPLIFVPDIGGSGAIFKECQDWYKSSVWALDRTQEPDITFSCIQDLVSFYLNQIKSERPVGPYRLAAFSGSSVVLVCLVKLLEESGDEVLQVAFLDHFPTCFLNPIADPSAFNPSDSEKQLDDYVNNNFRYLVNIMRIAAERPAAPEQSATLTWFAESLDAAVNNLPLHPFMEGTLNRMKNTISITIKFLFGDDFRLANGEWSRDLYISWLKSMKAEPVVYLMTEGIAAFTEDPEKELKTGLGVKEAYPNARIVIAPGDHVDILTSKIAIDDQEKGFV